MKETFLKLLDSFVKQRFPFIDKFDLTVLGEKETNILIVIQVKGKRNFSGQEKLEIRKSINTIFRSMGFENNVDFVISWVLKM